ncbi:MAG: nodulation protein NfeD [Chlamydiae bacterium]|nr:nodulation protein NfeD [Chlamydiota bacterium]MBI3266686.1 nodulation protein NfeD [Chlamydiota bacterium]
MKKSLFFTILFVLFISISSLASVAYRIDVEGPINDVLADFVVHSIQEAQDHQAPFVILRLSTPGGFDTAMRKIISEILGSRIPVIVYVGPAGARAASAGFFILLAGDVAVMASGTNTGSAHPLLALGGIYPIEKGKGMKTLSEKVMNDARAYLRGIAEKRGRNVEWAEKGITESKSYTEKEALEGKLIELVVKDEKELMKVLRGREVTRFSKEKVTLPVGSVSLKVCEMTGRQKILLAISDPNLALLLGLVGLLLIYFEFSNPGLIAPAVLGALCLLVSMIGFSILPINFVGALLMILALGLFIAEIKVQGFGILGIGGIISLLVGALILVDAPESNLGIRPVVAVAVVLSFGAILMLLVRLTVKSLHRKVQTGLAGMIGLTGVAHSAIGLEGQVHVRGEYWNAISSSPIPEGKKVRVVKVENLKVVVEEVKN